MVNSTTRNYFGLPIQLVTAAYQSTDSGGNPTAILVTQTLSREIRLRSGMLLIFIPKRRNRNFRQWKYDFWIPQLDWLPGQSGFSPTNTKPVAGYKHGRVLCLVYGYEGYGVFNVAAYAKLSVQNGYSVYIGYLQQYFDKAYKNHKWNCHNQHDRHSFTLWKFLRHRTRPGGVGDDADVDPPYQRGTCTVYCVSMQVDKNPTATWTCLSARRCHVTSQPLQDLGQQLAHHTGPLAQFGLR